MKYWFGNQFVFEHDIVEGASAIVEGYPAAKGRVLNRDGNPVKYFEFEIIPGTKTEGHFFDPIEGDNETTIVRVDFRYSTSQDGPWLVKNVIMPLYFFGLEDIPNDPTTAYQRAMQII